MALRYSEKLGSHGGPDQSGIRSNWPQLDYKVDGVATFKMLKQTVFNRHPGNSEDQPK